nr:PIN domain-containing protein [Rhizobium sp. SSA_523]
MVDTNVLLDLVTDDIQWPGWSVMQLAAAARQGSLISNDVIYAELAVRYASIHELDHFIEAAGLERVPISLPALFLAGKAFVTYRKAGGTRTGVLPDFFIGAQAATENVPLLTRDAGRYRTYFPNARLIAP